MGVIRFVGPGKNTRISLTSVHEKMCGIDQIWDLGID